MICLLITIAGYRTAPNDETIKNSREEKMDESMVWDFTPEAVSDDQQTVPIDLAMRVQLPPVPDQAVRPQVEKPHTLLFCW